MSDHIQAYGDRGDFEFLPYDPRFPGVDGSHTFSANHWNSGDAVLLRTVRENGRVGSVLLTTVVQDSDDLVALYLAPGTGRGCSGKGVASCGSRLPATVSAPLCGETELVALRVGHY